MQIDLKLTIYLERQLCKLSNGILCLFVGPLVHFQWSKSLLNRNYFFFSSQILGKPTRTFMRNKDIILNGLKKFLFERK